jgi:hypothetical protein
MLSIRRPLARSAGWPYGTMLKVMPYNTVRVIVEATSQTVFTWVPPAG